MAVWLESWTGESLVLDSTSGPTTYPKITTSVEWLRVEAETIRDQLWPDGEVSPGDGPPDVLLARVMIDEGAVHLVKADPSPIVPGRIY